MISVSSAQPNTFVVKDFNGVGADFVRCTFTEEIKMADKKSVISEKQATSVHASSVDNV
jgi:hypothetical protein